MERAKGVFWVEIAKYVQAIMCCDSCKDGADASCYPSLMFDIESKQYL